MINKFNIQDLLNEDQLEEDDDLSDQDPFDLIPNQASTKLADVIISYRYLGLFKDLSIKSMEELSRRRLSGDTFQFEKYIEDNLVTLPKLDMKVPNLDNILKNFGVMKK